MTAEIIQSSFDDAKALLDDFCSLQENLDNVRIFAEKIVEAIQNGNKIISCGNGGSMCDAMHFAEELTGRFRADRRSLPAVAISDPSHLTCTANDYGFDFVFSRYVEGLGNPGDLLLGISTSGQSNNIINAVNSAKEKGIYSVGLLGNGGGQLADLTDHSIIVPGATSDRIQELHIKIIHIAIEAVEKLIFNV